MLILVASGFTADSQWAHAINTVKTAQGFARLGHRVVLACRAAASGQVDPALLNRRFAIAEHEITWLQLPHSLLGVSTSRQWAFVASALPLLLRLRPDLVYSRSYLLPWCSARLGIPTVVECHAAPDHPGWEFAWLIRHSGQPALKGVITISERLRQGYRELGMRAPIAVVPDAVDLKLFARPAEPPPAPYSTTRPVALYSGHLYDYKGIPTILEAAARLPEVEFHLIGGWPQDVARHRERCARLGLSNTTFHGLIPHAEVPNYLWHADILLLPPSAHHPSAAWTSPVKLGEYRAAQRPVLATAIPALRDWLTPREAWFVPPDDPVAMAEGIAWLLAHPEEGTAIARAGRELANNLSYEHRAAAILNHAGY